ncbi:YndM family protein [Cytobacillus suaedae]|nr:YndM family protein [Cytobacillus suaedae]
MKHVKAIGIKYIFTSIILLSVFGIYYNSTVLEILLISALVTGVAYVVGDLFILPRLGNLVASLADMGLAFLSVWGLSLVFIDPPDRLALASLFAAVFIMLTEALFHAYMENKVLDRGSNNMTFNMTSFQNKFQTELAEEHDLQDINKREK